MQINAIQATLKFSGKKKKGKITRERFVSTHQFKLAKYFSLHFSKYIVHIFSP